MEYVRDRYKVVWEEISWLFDRFSLPDVWINRLILREITPQLVLISDWISSYSVSIESTSSESVLCNRIVVITNVVQNETNNCKPQLVINHIDNSMPLNNMPSNVSQQILDISRHIPEQVNDKTPGWDMRDRRYSLLLHIRLVRYSKEKWRSMWMRDVNELLIVVWLDRMQWIYSSFFHPIISSLVPILMLVTTHSSLP